MFTLYRVGKTIRYSGKHSLNLLIYLAVLVLRLVTFLIIPSMIIDPPQSIFCQ